MSTQNPEDADARKARGEPLDGQEAREIQAGEPVRIDVGYKGAWDEYNLRIKTRHDVLGMWVTASTVLLGFLYSLAKESLAQGPVRGVDPNIRLWLIAAAVPLVGFIASRVLWMHDSIMGGLHRHMIKCEAFANYANGKYRVPVYHWPSSHIERFFKARLAQDVAIVRIVFILNFAAIIILRRNIFRIDNFYGKLDITIKLCLILSSLFFFISTLAVLADARNARREAVEEYLPSSASIEGLWTFRAIALEGIVPRGVLSGMFQRRKPRRRRDG